MSRLHLTIPGKPYAWQRTGGSGRNRFTKPKGVAFKALVAQLVAASGWRGPAVASPCDLQVLAVYARPKARPPCAPVDLWKRGIRIPRPGQQDGDNVQKACMDALQRCGVLDDDRFVTSWGGSKVYAAVGEEAHTEVSLYVLTVPE